VSLYTFPPDDRDRAVLDAFDECLVVGGATASIEQSRAWERLGEYGAFAGPLSSRYTFRAHSTLHGPLAMIFTGGR
jgi:hypothetical protein